MNELTIGIVIIVISALGYISNWLNWRFLNYKINYILYYFGAFIHESSHALFCILTGAKITEYKVFVKQPHVTYVNSKIPIFGNLLIAIAPIFGGLTFVFLINKYFFAGLYIMPPFDNWRLFMRDLLFFLKQVDLSNWKNLITLFFFLNIGAMLGPSLQDLKNVWLLIIILIFIPWLFFTHLGLLSVALITINIIIQIMLIVILFILKIFK